MMATDRNRDRLVEIATAWRVATANIVYVPLSTEEMQRHFEQLTAEVLHALSTDQPATGIEQHGRAIGRSLVELNLLKSQALERTLTCLSLKLGVLGIPDQVRSLLVGISGGFVEATEATLLKQQESIRYAANKALRQAQEDLETSRDNLAKTNRALSAQIAERIRAEQIQREYAERLQRLHHISLAILSAESLPAIADISVNYIQQLIPALNIAALLIDSANNRSIILNSTHPAYPTGRIMTITMIEALSRLDEGEVIYYPDMREIRPPSRELTEIINLGGRSTLGVPLRYRDELIGGLIIVLDKVREFSEDEVAVTREIADSVTVAIQNRRLLEAERGARQRESTLREVAASLTLGLKPADLSQRILTQLDQVISCRSSAVFLLEDGVLEMVAERGVPEGVQEQIASILEMRPRYMWSVIETTQPRIINDTHTSPNWIAGEGFEYIRAWMGVPLMVKDNCVGLITIDRDKPHTFSERDRDLVLAFANQVAIAIDNVRLFDKQKMYVEQRAHELAVLYGITVAAVSGFDLESLLGRSLDLTLDAFNGLAAAVYLLEGEESRLQLAALVEGEPQAAAMLRDLSAADPILTNAFQSNAPPILSEPNLPADWPTGRPVSLAVIPLRSSGRDLGVFCLVCDAPDRPIKEALPLLTTVIDQIAVAVENIRLRQITRQSAIIEERERLAREIHDSITQAIYSIGLFTEVADSAAEAGDLTKVRQRLQSISSVVDQALRELRLLLFELRTESLARLGLVGALQERTRLVENQAGIQTSVRAHDCDDLPIPIEETYYRIALEALNNSLRHARTERVDIDLVVEDGHLEMSIADHGIGFDRTAADSAGGMGLDNMQKRIAKVNGVLTLASQIGGGTRVTVRAPLHQADYAIEAVK